MFTGIVEAIGSISEIQPLDRGRRVTFSHPGWREGLEIGSSISVDGCCLTVVESDAQSFEAELTRETLARTRFGELQPGSAVNLERPLAVGARLGGHWVQGHVDGVLRVRQIEGAGETCYFDINLPVEARDLVVPQGSIALNGVSLTVLEVDVDAFRVALIPHTRTNTTLGRLRAGERVHVEYDILAKYVVNTLNRGLAADASR
jgi:riboflavin synthase